MNKLFKSISISFVLCIISHTSVLASYEENISHNYVVSSIEMINVHNQDYMVFDLNPEDELTEACQECLGHKKHLNNAAFLTLNLSSNLIAAHSLVYLDPAYDKLRHFSAGYIAGNVTSGVLQWVIPMGEKNRRIYSFIGGVGASLIIGVGKEVRDSLGHGQVEMNDALATIAGGITGSFAIGINEIETIIKKTPKTFEPLKLKINQDEFSQ